jgi:branched-chain amino acid transport system ATP-binding protein
MTVPDTAGSSPALRTEQLVKTYGRLRATDGVDLTLRAGERRAVIGPNGAGKSTLFNMLAGAIRPTSGRIWLHGQDVTRLPEYKRARRGLARTYQHSALFTSLTCVENVSLVVRRVEGVGTRLLLTRSQQEAVHSAANSYLDQVVLSHRANDPVASLSHGERRQLEVAMALAAKPAVLLFDEPTAGMSTLESNRFIELVAQLPSNLTILIIEHDLDVVFALADTITVLVAGSVLEEGSPEQIRGSSAVEEAYLGTGHEEVFLTS